LKFGLDATLSHFVNSVLFVHCIADETQDGFARYIKKAECTSIASPKNKSEVMEADGILKRCMQLLHEHNRLQDSDSMEAMKTLKVSIAEKVLSKNKHDARSLADIAEVFVSKVCGLSSEPSITQSASSSKDHGVECTNVVRYDEDGSLDGLGRITFLNKGFKIGMFVVLKKATIPARGP
jgi:hypothetical protein